MTDSWREKYLQLLDEQEQGAAHFAEQQELLRQAVVKLSLAAQGQDSELDEQLTTLRANLRKGYQRPGEVRLIQLDDQLRSFEHRREQFADTIAVHFSALSEQLQNSPISGTAVKPLRQFQRQLSDRAKQVSDYPKLLQELSLLQQQCLESLNTASADKTAAKSESTADEQKTGFLSKLFGAGKEPAGNVSAVPDKPVELDQSQIEIVQDTDAEAVFTECLEPNEHAKSRPEPSNDGVTPAIEGQYQASGDIDDNLHEPAFSHISTRVNYILNDLLDSVEAEECVLHKVTATRLRIERGLNWYELVPALEDIRDLVMQAYLAADKKFSAYLLSMSEQLQEIYALVKVDVQQQTALSVASDDLQAQVADQLLLAEQSVRGASHLDQLKGELEGQIGAIRRSLQSFSEVKAENDGAADLQDLMAKVESLEADAQAQQVELERLRQKAMLDSLTQLPNREAWSERSYLEFQRWKRYQRSLVVAVIDIDLFKRVNDNYGHQAGDRVLKVIGNAVNKRLRDVDFFARYGGEEFSLLLPETEPQSALELLNRIREAIASASFHFKEKPITITISIGLTAFRGDDSIDSAFARADKALYAAKAEGRNRCVLAP